MTVRSKAVSSARAIELSEEARVVKVARLLQRAARKYNESAGATSSLAGYFDSPGFGGLDDGLFDTVFDAVTHLAGISEDNEPDYQRAALDLIKTLARKSPHRVSRKSKVRN
jgi:hypothetical protein